MNGTLVEHVSKELQQDAKARAVIAQQSGLTTRWTPLKPHPEQRRLWTSRSRFKVVPAGRRSGKTEFAKRTLILAALQEHRHPNAWFVAAAPVRDQAKRIYWQDLKDLTPKWALAKPARESDLTLEFITGAKITVMGMEEPARVEGSPLSGIVLDEYANMKARIWGDNVRPALADRGGWAWLIGVPEGRNHYHKRFLSALTCPPDPRTGIKEWDGFTWVSADILPAAEIESARNELDEMTFQQEFNASFVTFSGRAYYGFNPTKHAIEPVHKLYNPKAPLIICLDFNVEPGVAVVCQEIGYTGVNTPVQRAEQGTVTAVLGEVWIPKNSNTEAVCRKLIQDWGHHKGPVKVYGDATGGARGTAKTKGSDWDIVKRELRPQWMMYGFSIDVPDANPTERARINAMNSRICTASGIIRMLVDGLKAPHVVQDLEGVTLLEGGSGEIDKSIEKAGLNHISSALGYYIERVFPIHGGHTTIQQTV